MRRWLDDLARRHGRLDLPADATFRRAEGLTFHVSACAPAEVRVEAERVGGPTTATITRGELRWLCHATRWSTAEEMHVTHARAVMAVRDNHLFWSSERPARDLSSVEAPAPDGPARWRANAWPRLLIRRGDTVEPFPFMPRRGSMDGAEVVGVEVRCFEFGMATHGVRITCCPRHGEQLRELVAALSYARVREGLDHAYPEVMPLLLDAGLLERAPPPEVHLPGAAVTWLGHAAFLHECANTRLLVDPLFHPRSVPAREGSVPPPDPRLMGRVDAVLITHGDNDHFNPQALAWIPRDVPVVIPRAAKGGPWQVDMERVLALLGFTTVHRVAWGDTVRVGEVTVVATPFHGENWGLQLASCTYVIAHPELTVFASADSLLPVEMCREMREQHAPNVAFLGVTGNEEAMLSPPGLGYGNFYALWIPAAERNRWVQHCAGPADAARAAVELGVKRAVAYAAGGVEGMEPAFSDVGCAEDFHDELAKLGRAELAWMLEPGRRVVVPG